MSALRYSVRLGPAVPLRRYDSASGGLLAKPGSPAEGEDVPGEAKGRKVTRAPLGRAMQPTLVVKLSVVPSTVEHDLDVPYRRIGVVGVRANSAQRG